MCTDAELENIQVALDPQVDLVEQVAGQLAGASVVTVLYGDGRAKYFAANVIVSEAGTEAGGASAGAGVEFPPTDLGPAQQPCAISHSGGGHRMRMFCS